MANNTLNNEIQSRINSFLGELSQLVKRQALEAVHEALGEAAAPRRGPGRPRSVTMSAGRRPRAIAKGGVRGKRSPEQVDAMAARVLAQIRSKQGQRLEEIGRAMKMPTKGLKLPIAKLMAGKKLKTKGAKRGTKYFVR
jgi:hypothetical protein